MGGRLQELGLILRRLQRTWIKVEKGGGFSDSGSPSDTGLHEPFLGWLYLGKVSLFEGSKCCLCSLFHRLQQPPPPWSEQRETGLNRN